MSEKWFPSGAERLTLRGFTRFDESLMEVVNDVLVQVFGETAAKFIIEFITFKILQKDQAHISFGEDAGIFDNILQGILGAGSIPIERLIVEQLHAKLGVKFEEKKNYVFSDYIRELRKKVKKE